MVSLSALMSAVALTSTYSVAQAQQIIQKLPWDGRAGDLVNGLVTDKYLTYAFVRNDTSLTVADYVTIDHKGRPKGYNCDEGVINISVDGDAIKEAQTNFRRSDLMQLVATNPNGETFIRTSFKKDEAFLNKYLWHVICDEMHFFDVVVDASLDPPMIRYINNLVWEPIWETEFVPGTWYNFGIAFSGEPSGGVKLDFYTSEGLATLKHIAAKPIDKEFPTNIDFHIGPIAMSDDGGPLKMAEKPDVMSYSGVSISSDVSTHPQFVGSPYCK